MGKSMGTEAAAPVGTEGAVSPPLSTSTGRPERQLRRGSHPGSSCRAGTVSLPSEVEGSELGFLLNCCHAPVCAHFWLRTLSHTHTPPSAASEPCFQSTFCPGPAPPPVHLQVHFKFALVGLGPKGLRTHPVGPSHMHCSVRGHWAGLSPYLY